MAEEPKPDEPVAMEDVSIGVDSGVTPAETEDAVEPEQGTMEETTEEAPAAVAEEETGEIVPEETPTDEGTGEGQSGEAPATSETFKDAVEKVEDIPAASTSKSEEEEAEVEAEKPTEEPTPAEEKSQNPLEAVGSWFQKLGGGASKSDVKEEPPKAAANTEANAEASEEPSPTEEPSNVVITSDQSEKPEAEPTPVTAAGETETQTKQAGWSLGVATLFGTSPKAAPDTTAPEVTSLEDDEPLEIQPEEIKIEDDGNSKFSWGLGGLFIPKKTKKGDQDPEDETTSKEMELDVHPDERKPAWGNNFGAIFRRNKKTGIDGITDNAKTLEDDDDENAKKKGGLRQKCSAFCRSQEGKIIIIACIALFLFLAVLIPLFASSEAESEMSEVFKNLGKVDSYLQAQIIKFPGYDGDLYPDGHVTLRFGVEDRFLATFRVGGLEETCEGCTWMITEGNTCHDETKVGELFYDHQNPNLVTHNPFLQTRYQTQNGFTETSTVNYNGYNLEQNTDRVFVLQNHQGIFVGCGVLKKFGHPYTYPKLWANVRSLPNYAGTSEVDVKVRMDFFTDRAFHFGYTGTGLPKMCGMCMVAVHEATSCEQPEGGTFWDSAKMPSDPWVTAQGAFYASDGNGILTGRPGFYLYDGFSDREHKGHVVILRDAANVPIACGELHTNSKYVWRDAAVQQMVTTGEKAIAATGSLTQHGYLRNNNNMENNVAADSSNMAQSLVNIGVEAANAIEEVVGLQQ